MEIIKQKVNEFRDLFPQFKSTAVYPDSVIQFRFNLAELLLNKVRFGKLIYYATHLYVSHYLVLYARDANAIEAGIESGVVSSKSIDKVSVSYDTNSTLSTDAGFWNYTRYGQELYQLMILIGAGGIQLPANRTTEIWR